MKRKDHVSIQCLFQEADAIPSFCAQMLSDMHVAPVVDMAVEKGDDHVQFLGLLDLVLLDGLRMARQLLIFCTPYFSCAVSTARSTSSIAQSPCFLGIFLPAHAPSDFDDLQRLCDRIVHRKTL